MALDFGLPDTRTEQEILEEYTDHYQKECHSFCELAKKGGKKIGYQDATNVWLFTKLAELTISINKLKYPKK